MSGVLTSDWFEREGRSVRDLSFVTAMGLMD